MNPREQVIEDVLSRLVEEHGTEVGVLDWVIFDKILETNENLGATPPDKTRE